MTASKTFNNLSEIKKHLFLEQAYQEFAFHDYESASITHLVKELGIAKGSVYQYFKDKQTLYEHLLSHAYNTLEELTAQACPIRGDDDFFDWFTRYLIVQTKFQLSFPLYALLFQHIDKRTEPETINIHKEIESRWENDLIINYPTSLSDSHQYTSFLASIPRIMFRQLVQLHQIDLLPNTQQQLSIDIEGQEIVDYCTRWTNLVKTGIPI